MSEVISSCRSLRAGSQVFALQLLCMLHFGMLCLSDIIMMFVKKLLAVCMLVGMLA